MRILVAGAAFGALVLALPVAAQQVNPTKAAADQTFIQKAVGGGLGEVKLGQLAESKASNTEVKQFGRRMVQDHAKANEQLKAALTQQGVTVPTQIDPEAQQDYNKLSKLSGQQFDREYVKGMVEDHRKDVTLFEDEAKNGKDPALKQFAQQTLPTLREHLQMAEKLAKQEHLSSAK
jgi:putative membrane protein